MKKICYEVAGLLLSGVSVMAQKRVDSTSMYENESNRHQLVQSTAIQVAQTGQHLQNQVQRRPDP